MANIAKVTKNLEKASQEILQKVDAEALTLQNNSVRKQYSDRLNQALLKN